MTGDHIRALARLVEAMEKGADEDEVFVAGDNLTVNIGGDEFHIEVHSSYIAVESLNKEERF